MNSEFSQLGMRWSFYSNHTTKRSVTSPLFPEGKEALIGSITPISLSQPSATLWPINSDHASQIYQKQTSGILCHCPSICPGIFGLKIVTMQVQIQIWTWIQPIDITQILPDVHALICVFSSVQFNHLCRVPMITVTVKIFKNSIARIMCKMQPICTAQPTSTPTVVIGHLSPP